MTPHSNHNIEIEPPKPMPPARRGRRLWIALVGLVALAVVLVPIWRGKRASDEKRAAAVGGKGMQAERKPSVRVLTLQPQPFAVVLEGLGSVTPLATVTVKPQVDGPLLSVAFQEGGEVHKGQLLAEIDPRPFRIKLEQAQAAVARDRATLKNAELDLTRFTTLREQKLIAQQQLDAQRSTVEQLRAGLQVDQAAADDAALQLAYTRITSPIDGVAGIRQVDPGNLVHASDTTGIVVLTRLDPIAVIFTLPQDELPRLAAAMADGQRTVTAVSRAGDEVLGKGELRVIDNQVNSATATVKLKAQFDNPEHKLWPNLFVRARIEVAHQDAALVVPAAAVQQGPNGPYVYALAAGNIAKMHPVQIQLLQGDQAVIASGVQAGDRIVVEGQEQIKPDSEVTPRAASDVAKARKADRPAAADGGNKRAGKQQAGP
jgi:multidrug efflux system membrane fusion protein